MSPFLANIVSLFVVCAIGVFLSLALLWRVGSWRVSSAEVLNTDEGLPVGSVAPDVAGHHGAQDAHLEFGAVPTFLVFGASTCQPCKELLSIAPSHPALRGFRFVYVGDSEELDLHPSLLDPWEIYRFNDEASARALWRAPVSPYFHFIDDRRRVVAKGIANKPEHLDRLLMLQPKHRLIEPLDLSSLDTEARRLPLGGQREGDSPRR